MNDKYKLLQANPKVCKRLFGLDFVQFEQVLEKVQLNIDTYLAENPLSNRGIEGQFTVPNQLLLTFEYLRQYPTCLSMGFSYGISESYCHKLFHRMRDILADVVGLKNPTKLRYEDVKAVIVDVTVQPIERPQQDQQLYYNGGKGRHIVKSQLIVDEEELTIEHCQVEREGRKADRRIFRETTLQIPRKIKVKADLAYVGIDKIHERSQIPRKKPRNSELTKKQKRQNKAFRRRRVRIEHVNRLCKCFRIVKETYRNKLNHIEQIWLIMCGLLT